MIKAIIFDYDGVIVDSFPAVHKVYQIICKALGKHCPTNFEDFRKAYGERSKELSKNLGFSEQDIIDAEVIYQREIIKQNPAFFNGVKEVIQNLSAHYKLYLVSSSPKTEVKSKIETLGVVGNFRKILGGDHTGPMHKSAPIISLLKEEDLHPNEVIMIGDRVNDYRVAQDCGIKNIILVEYGWGYDPAKVPDYKPKMKVNKPLDLLEAVKRIST